MPARWAAAVFGSALGLAADHEPAAIRADLAEQRPRELDLAAAHEAVDAEDLAGPDVHRDVLEGAAEAEAFGLHHHRVHGAWRASLISPV